MNNAVYDAANLGRALQEHSRNGKPLEEVIAAYEAEMIERGRDAVILSGQNSMMVHDWEQLKKSPLFTAGLVQDKKE